MHTIVKIGHKMVKSKKRRKVGGSWYEEGEQIKTEIQLKCLWCSRVLRKDTKTSWKCLQCGGAFCRDGTAGRNCFHNHAVSGYPEKGAWRKAADHQDLNQGVNQAVHAGQICTIVEEGIIMH